MLIGPLLFVLGLAPAARAIENLNCELSLRKAGYEIVPGATTEVARDEVVIRGRLEVNFYLSSVPRLRYGVRDVEGFERIFAQPGDSLHYLEPGDRVYLLTSTRRVLLHGFYGESRTTTTIDVSGEFRDIEVPQPKLFSDRPRKVPRITPERFVDMFKAQHEVVVVKRIDAETLERMRARLNPQLQLYRAHVTNNPARFVDIVPDRPPYELRVFEALIEGRLTDVYPNFPDRSRKNLYTLKLALTNASGTVSIREGDRVFLFGDGGELLTEYEVVMHPLLISMPEHSAELRALIEALGREARTKLIRKVGR